MTTTLQEYREQGGVVAFAPGELTHVYLHVDRSTGQTADGGQRREIGLVPFQCDVVEGRRVVRLPSLASYVTLKMADGSSGTSGADWQRLNPELDQLLAAESRRAGPIG